MITRVAFGRNGQCILRGQMSPNSRRCLATAASGTFLYETGDASGVRFASRDLPGPTTHLAVVAKAGTRYQPLPGFSEGLEKFSFKNTQKRSALRITRETELLGGEYNSYHSRENLVIGAKFLREDLPYFAELIGEVISQTKYTAHELQEEVEPNMDLSRKKLLGDPIEFAINSAHGVAFHRGLGNSLHPSSSTPMAKYLSANRLQQYSRIAYAKSNFAVVANGTNHQELSKWINEFFTELEQSPAPDFPSIGIEPTRYYGGEERIAHNSGNAMVIAFPGSGSATGSSYKPVSQVLAALLGGQSNIKWTPGFSLLSKATASYSQAHIATAHHAYSDAGLLTITINGDAHQIRQASQEVVQAIRNVAVGNVTREEVVKAVATAKFKALESGQNMNTGIELTGAGIVQGGKALQIDELAKSIDSVAEDQVKKAAKALLDGKATVSTVGDLYILPFAEEIGLNV